MKSANANKLHRKSGKAHQSFNVQPKRVSLMGQNPDRGSVIPQVKAFENTIFGPRTPHGRPGQVGRTWGTRSIPSDFAMTQSPPGLDSGPTVLT
jgi:hypothetical protein